MNAQAEILFQQRLCASFQGRQARASVHILNFVRARQVRQHATTHFTPHWTPRQGIQNPSHRDWLRYRLRERLC